MTIKKVLFVFLFIKVMSGRLKGIVLSVSMLRFQYSLKLKNSMMMIIIIIILLITTTTIIIIIWRFGPFPGHSLLATGV